MWASIARYTVAMHLSREGKLIRTDIWREGKWLDLWSVVHLLSGASIGFVFHLLPFDARSSVIIVFLLLTGYEMWEKIVQIEETPTNRVMDVVVGMVSFLPVYFFVAPELHATWFILTFGFILTANVVMSVFGWIASQKAAALEVRLRERYEKRRALLRERRAHRQALRSRI